LGYLPKEEEIVEETTPKATEGAQPLAEETGPSPTSTAGALVSTPKPLWKRGFEAFQDLKRGTCKALRGFCGFLKTFTFWVMVLLVALSIWGKFVEIQPLKAARNWLHLSERRSARSWCQSAASSGWVSYGETPYPPSAETPSVRIAPRIWCNAHSPTKGVALKMKKLFPHLN
jgi:hypothetical protein